MSSASWTLDQDLKFWKSNGIDHVCISLRKVVAAGWDSGLAAIRAAGLGVSAVLWPAAFHLDMPARWDDERAAANRAVDAAHMLGAKCLAMTAGPPGRMLTDEAATAFRSAIAPVLDHARSRGVAIALENNSPLRRDIGFLHTLADTVAFARETGIGICVELNNCWTEYRLADLFRAGRDLFHIVQVSDYVIGTATTPDRAVPGDGDMPLARLLQMLLDAGYEGPFDLEILGPRIEKEGYPSAISRGIEWLSGTLSRLGA
ncbi:MAG TPA: sugar phosphate isomerase/epimerase family protein [Amycolatopsis sp.]|nr:sugar phosphate isomerase/epimerase family protein [Amycolatopsis sp.]